jgi:DNA-binding SARP family transcriptional activator
LGRDVTTDVERVDGLIRRGLEPGPPRDRADALAGALVACTGPAFAGLDDWTPARAETTRLAERIARAEDELLALRLELDGAGGTIAELEAAVVTEPLRERRWVLLAEALRDSGRTKDALDALNRARRVFASELGTRPGPVLQALEDELLAGVASPIDDPALRLERHREAADTAAAEGDARRAAKELAAALELARATGRPANAQADLLIALGRAQRRAGDPAAARKTFLEGAVLARHARDPGRLAEAAQAASGEAWQTTFDSSSGAIPLLEEALEALPTAPSPVRARLLARHAVAASHVRDQDALAVEVAQAEVIAGIVHDPLTTATVLLARSIIDQDPFRLRERQAVVERLVQLAAVHAQPEWHTWAVPQLARITAQQGDVDGAAALLEDLAGSPATPNDVAAAAAGGSAELLRATTRSDFDGALTAVEAAVRAIEPTMIEPSAGVVMRWAMTTVLRLAYDRLEAAPDSPMKFPLATMNAMTIAYVAAVLGATDRAAEGREALGRLDPADLSDLPRDLYWLSLVWALGRAVWELGAVDHAVALHELAAPVTDLLVVDGGFNFLGAVAHHSGLAAAVAGRTREAHDLLSSGLATHERLRSPHWTEASRRALDSLPTRAGQSR